MKSRTPARLSKEEAIARWSLGEDVKFKPDLRLSRKWIPLSQLRTIAKYQSFHTDFICEITVYNDNFELYRYSDDIEILRNSIGAAKINGRFISTKEWQNELVYTYKDVDGDLVQIQTLNEVRVYSEAFDVIWKLMARESLLLNYDLPLEQDVDFLAREMRALTTRNYVLDSLFKQYCAKLPLDSLFTLGGSRPRPKTSPKKPSIGKRGRGLDKTQPPDSAMDVLREILSNDFKDLPHEKTVAGSVRSKIIGQLGLRGIRMSHDTLRSYLSRLGYSSPRDSQ